MSADFEKEIMPFKPLMDKIAIGYLGDYDQSQDVIQKVLIKLWEKRETIYSGDDMQAFVSTVVKNQCIDELRKSKCEQLDENTLITVEQRPSLMDNLISTLEDGDKKIMIMKYEDGMTFKEIGEKLNKTKDSVRHRHDLLLLRMKTSLLASEKRVISRGI